MEMSKKVVIVSKENGFISNFGFIVTSSLSVSIDQIFVNLRILGIQTQSLRMSRIFCGSDSHLSVHQNHLEGLWKPRLVNPFPRVSGSRGLEQG